MYKTADATHLATAVSLGADGFITSNRRDFGPRITEIDVNYPAESGFDEHFYPRFGGKSVRDHGNSPRLGLVPMAGRCWCAHACHPERSAITRRFSTSGSCPTGHNRNR
jgi:hypothetical protein